MKLAPFVRIVARGKGRARSLSIDEADDAMSVILSGNAAPEAIGALLMVMRLRGETDSEIAGFTRSLRRSSQNALPTADLDWPCYAAGRTRGAPLFLLAAKLVCDAGFSVSMHGWNSHQSTTADLRRAVDTLGIVGGRLNYTSLDRLNPIAFELLQLRDIFGLRSCINTVLRMWNPSGATASVQGIFHPSYRGLQSRAATLLGDQNLTVIKGGGGEFERNPAKDVTLFGLRRGGENATTAQAILSSTRRLHDPKDQVEISALWTGTRVDAFAQATVIGTAALALWTLRARATVHECETMAQSLWSNRNVSDRKTA